MNGIADDDPLARSADESAPRRKFGIVLRWSDGNYAPLGIREP